MRPHIFSFSWLCFKTKEIKCIRIPLVSQNNNKKSLWSRHCHFHLNARHWCEDWEGFVKFADTEMWWEECWEIPLSSIPHIPPPASTGPDGWLRILRVVVAELGRKCWWNLKWCWKAELEIGVMSAYPHGNNPAYISIFYENAMCRISSKCNMVNIFQRYQYNFDNIINILYCEQHDPNIYPASLLVILDMIALPLISSPSPLPTFVWPEFN